MGLRSIRVENYRAVGEGSLTLGETTVLIGENDCGRTSMVEALMLLLGAPDERFESRLRPFHFHRRPDGTTGPLRIILRVAEEPPGSWTLPESIRPAFPAAPGRRRDLEFEFRADLNNPAQRIAIAFRVRAVRDSAAPIECGPDVLDWLRRLIPALWLRTGLVTQEAAQTADPSASGPVSKDPDLAALDHHYRNLLTGSAPDLAAELEGGARAARRVMEKHPRMFAGAVPMMSAMASDLLRPREVAASAVGARDGATAGKIGLLLLLGSILQLAYRSLSPSGRPVLVVENPESNLHPMTLATVWRTIERITWQKVIATNSGTLLANAPLSSIRRLTRTGGKVREWCVPPRSLSRDDLRRVSYHIRSRRSAAMFARCWLLVEGETEYWMIPELARVCGFDFSAEGVACVEFAQCGISALIALADRLGIAWHVLADGDDAGERYAATARQLVGSQPPEARTGKITRLRERDIEHCFWHSGFAGVIEGVARPGAAPRGGSPSTMIRKAIEKTSKPFLALSLIDAVAERGPQSVPAVLCGVIESSISMARPVSA